MLKVFQFRGKRCIPVMSKNRKIAMKIFLYILVILLCTIISIISGLLAISALSCFYIMGVLGSIELALYFCLFGVILLVAAICGIGANYYIYPVLTDKINIKYPSIDRKAK